MVVVVVGFIVGNSDGVFVTIETVDNVGVVGG